MGIQRFEEIAGALLRSDEEEICAGVKGLHTRPLAQLGQHALAFSDQRLDRVLHDVWVVPGQALLPSA